MKMTNEEMRVSIDVLAQTQEAGKLGYAIARNLRKLRDAAKEYIEMRDKLLQEYGTPSKTPGQVSVTVDAWQKITAELGDIPEITSDVDVFRVDEDTFCSGGLKSNQMSALLWMVKE
ncbi:MAG: hypothetical protein LIP12_17760 [Clostridiales bacterium]|nr:hypothetical protein [Clostridiales bacterium]